jgi:hypothetical protein
MADDLNIESMSSLQVITQAEVESQIDIAKRWPRELAVVKRTVLEMAAGDQESAADCFFALPRQKKNDKGVYEDVKIEGESIRLAEIVANSWKNLRTAKRIIAIDKVNKTVTAQAMVHDLESNRAASVEEMRSIGGKDGRIYSHDMIIMTAKAAMAIALRNAIFEVIPKVMFKGILKEVKEVSTGAKKGYLVDEKDWKPIPLEERVAKAVKYFVNWSISEERIFKALGVKTIEEISEEHLATLTGMRTGITQGEYKLTDAFPETEADKSKAVGKEIVDKVKSKKSDAKESMPKDDESGGDELKFDGDPSKIPASDIDDDILKKAQEKALNSKK